MLGAGEGTIVEPLILWFNSHTEEGQHLSDELNTLKEYFQLNDMQLSANEW